MFRPTGVTLKAVATVCVGVSLSGHAVADVDHTFQAWSAAFVQARLTDAESSLGAWLDVHSRRGADATAVLFRPGVGWYFGRSVSVWAGYLLNPTFRDGARDTYEHRPWEQVQIVLGSGDAVWTLRTRFEQRLLHDDARLGWRLRQLVRWQQKVAAEAALVAWDEAFVGLNEPGWGQPAGFDQNRAFVGSAWLVQQGVRLEAGYLSVVSSRPDVTTVVHGLSLNAFVSW